MKYGSSGWEPALVVSLCVSTLAHTRAARKLDEAKEALNAAEFTVEVCRDLEELPVDGPDDGHFLAPSHQES